MHAGHEVLLTKKAFSVGDDFVQFIEVIAKHFESGPLQEFLQDRYLQKFFQLRDFFLAGMVANKMVVSEIEIYAVLQRCAASRHCHNAIVS